jgi:hypothetical protein
MRSYIDTAVNDWVNAYAPMDKSSLAAIEARLQTYLAGGTGLSPEIEQAIYDRGRAKLEAEQARPAMEASRAAMRAGYEIPGPAFWAGQQRVAQAAADANGRAAIDIATKMAEMEQQNLQFALTAAKDLRVAIRNVAVQYAGLIGQTNSQALEYAKAVVDALRAVRDAAIRYFEALMRLYETDGQIYETLIKAALTDLTRLEAEVRVAEAVGRLDETQGRVFQSQIDSDKSLVALYAEQMRVLELELNRRKLLIEGFLAEIQGFEGEIKGKELEVDIYKALMSGDETLVHAKVAEYQAWASKADALLKGGDLEIKKSDAVATANKNIIEAFDGELKEYMSDVDLERIYSDEDFKVFEGRINKYKADLDALNVKLTTHRDYDRMELERANWDLNSKTQIAMETGRLNESAMAHRIQGLQGIAQVAGEVSSSYANSVQGLAALQSQEST